MDHVHLTPLQLDLVVLGRLPNDKRQGLDEHLAGCPVCAGRLAERRATEAHFASVVGPRTAPAVARRLQRQPTVRALRWSVISAPVLAAAAVVLLKLCSPNHGVPPQTASRPEPTVDDRVAIKGGPILRVFARRASIDQAPGAASAFAVEPGTRLHAGDAVRFVVEAPGKPQLLIASVDSAGSVNVYVPYGGLRSEAVEPTRRFESPQSIVLDVRAGVERVFVFVSDASIDAAKIRSALEPLAKAGEQAIRRTQLVALDGPETLQASQLLEFDSLRASP